MMVPQNLARILEETVTKVRNIKNNVNTLWPDHLDVLGPEDILYEFDHIIDGLFELLRCYQRHVAATNEEENEAIAKGALVECVRAGCTVFDPIATKIEKQADRAIPIWSGAALGSPRRRRDEAKKLRMQARRLWENDDEESCMVYMRCISAFEEAIEEANAIRRPHRMIMWAMNPLVISGLAFLAIILALIAIFFK